MFFHKKIIIVIVLGLWCTTAFGAVQYQPLPTEETKLDEIVVAPHDQYNVYKAIAREYSKSLTACEGPQGIGAVCEECEKEGQNAFLKKCLECQMCPNEDSRQRLVLQLLSDYYDKASAPQSTVMDEITWQDLNLLCGPKSNPRGHLASKIVEGRAVTAAGIATIFRMLVEPMTDINKLHIQQAITQKLVHDEKLFHELDAKLKELVIPENILLSFWNDEDIFSGLIFRQMKRKIPFDEKFAIAKRFSDWFNKSPRTLELYSRTEDAFGYIAKGLLAYGVIALPVAAASGHSIIPGVSADELNNIPPYTMLGLMSFAAGKMFVQSVASRIKSVLATYGYWKNAYYEGRGLSENFVTYKCMYQKIAYLAQYLANLKSMEQFVNQHSELAQALPSVQNFAQNLKELTKTIPDFKLLIDILESDTFKGEYTLSSYFMSCFSKVMVAYKLMQEHKDRLVNAMLAVGELDAQLTIAKLYKDFQHTPVKFCFPTFIQNSRPMIIAENFWNPFLKADIVVPNSIQIGNTNPQNVIITGPNAGGKSTITKALVFGLILGQSLGIAPSQALAFTPATTIMTYLNITDDIAAGASHFQAGVNRAVALLKASKQLNYGECGLFAVDEVFNGTTHKEGQAAAFTLIEELGKNPAVICVTNTHFPLITTLEQSDGLFRNYKVSVIEREGEKIMYPYRLEPGISHQNVALKILEERGCGEEFVRRAQLLLEQDN
ncbi:MAG: hypothetical protein WCW33_04140 [Candidatus Babeliales bacterium]|jgi:DNA mismatch repair ATPase MutS